MSQRRSIYRRCLRTRLGPSRTLMHKKMLR
jgi:hypothetical protein